MMSSHQRCTAPALAQGPYCSFCSIRDDTHYFSSDASACLLCEGHEFWPLGVALGAVVATLCLWAVGRRNRQRAPRRLRALLDWGRFRFTGARRHLPSSKQHLLASEACRTRCAQSAGCFPGLVGSSAASWVPATKTAVFEPASRQQSGARPSGASQSRPLAMFLIIAGLGSCAANQSAPAPTQGSQPPAAPNLPKAAVPVEMLAGTMDRGPSVGKLPSTDVSRIVLHGRRLNQVSVAIIAVRLASTLTLHPTLFHLLYKYPTAQLNYTAALIYRHSTSVQCPSSSRPSAITQSTGSWHRPARTD